jgi:hypothetical protein
LKVDLTILVFLLANLIKVQRPEGWGKYPSGLNKGQGETPFVLSCLTDYYLVIQGGESLQASSAKFWGNFQKGTSIAVFVDDFRPQHRGTIFIPEQITIAVNFLETWTVFRPGIVFLAEENPPTIMQVESPADENLGFLPILAFDDDGDFFGFHLHCRYSLV